MRIHRNTRSKLIYGVILVMTVAIGVGGLYVSQTLAGKLAEASLVTAPALGDAALIERQVGTVQVRLDGIVAASGRHEMQNVADQVKYLTGRQDVMTVSFDRLQQGHHTEVVKAGVVKLRNITSDWWRKAATVEDLAGAQNQAAATQALVLTHQVNDQAQQASADLSALIRKELSDLAASGQEAYASQRIWMLLLLAGTRAIAVSRMIAAERVSRKLEKISDDCVEGGNDLATAAAQGATSSQSLAQ